MGWFAFRLDAVAGLQTPTDSADIHASTSALNGKLPPKLPFKATTVVQLAMRVCQFFPLIIVNGTSSEDGNRCIAGTIIDVEDDTIVLREMSTRFEWLPDLLRIELKHIKYFLFGSEYEDVLTQIGDLNGRI